MIAPHLTTYASKFWTKLKDSIVPSGSTCRFEQKQNSLSSLAFMAVLSIWSLPGWGQISRHQVDTMSLAKDILYKGVIQDAVRWTDNKGENLVIITETGVYTGKTKECDRCNNAELFAYHFSDSIGNTKHTWKVYDYVKNCPVDIIAGFIERTLQVTDLDGDGTGEVWLMYKTGCRGDIGPDIVKIIMYQGRQKYAMRGEETIKTPNGASFGGSYVFDNAFGNAPEVFRKFAKSMWTKHGIRTYE